MCNIPVIMYKKPSRTIDGDIQMQQVMFTMAFFCAMGLTVLTSRAQDDFAQFRLEKLFSQAIKAEDMEYVALRDEILRENEADKFLEEKAKSKNLMTRVIGRAMLSWKSDFATNMWESEKAIKTVNEMLRSRIGQNRIFGNLYTAKDQPGWVKPESPVAVILLEIALKGPSLKINPEYSRVPRDGLLVRSYAAGWSGLYDDPDVVPVLLMLGVRRSTDLVDALRRNSFAPDYKL